MDDTNTKHINEVLVNDVLATDIYVNNKLFLRKNTLLTHRLIENLKSRKIKTICITTQIKNQPDKTNSDDEKIIQSEDTIPPLNKNQHYYNEIFIELLEQVGNETRYGNILSSSDELEYITELFLKICQKHCKLVDELTKLKEWDYYSFIHSFDVFVLGSLFARREGIQDLESIALGYLFHDIGKLHIPQELLQLQRKLSYKEFDIMKKHTTEGFAILNSIGLNHVAHFAKSHHERIDGSGYPEKLAEQELEKGLRILHLIDVYSALTLKRPYREALSTSKALDILSRNTHQFDQVLLRNFIESLKIYPTNSTVLLSDNTFAKVEEQNEELPAFPKVKRLIDSQTFNLPFDFNISITKMIQYQSKSFQDRFKDLSNSFLSGNEANMLNEFNGLADGLKLEEIYTEIILPIYRVLILLHQEKKIETKQFDLRITSIIKLLQHIEDSLVKANQYKATTLFVVEDRQQSPIHLKILQGLLHIESIYPIIIESSALSDDFLRIIMEYNVESICLLNSISNNKLQISLFPSEIKFKRLSYKNLTALIDSITPLSKQPFTIYDRLLGINLIPETIYNDK